MFLKNLIKNKNLRQWIHGGNAKFMLYLNGFLDIWGGSISSECAIKLNSVYLEAKIICSRLRCVSL